MELLPHAVSRARRTIVIGLEFCLNRGDIEWNSLEPIVDRRRLVGDSVLL